MVILGFDAVKNIVLKVDKKCFTIIIIIVAIKFNDFAFVYLIRSERARATQTQRKRDRERNSERMNYYSMAITLKSSQ